MNMRVRRTLLGPVLRFGPALRDGGTGEPLDGPTGPPKNDPPENDNPDDDNPDGDDSGDDDDGPKFKGKFDPDRAKRALKSARENESAAKKRAQEEKARADKVEAENKSFREQLAVSLGLKPDPKTDVTEVARQATEAAAAKDKKIAELAQENTLLRVAGKANADVEALRDSRSFMDKLSALNHEDNDYVAQVEKLVKAAVKDNGRFASTKGGTSKGRVGGDHTGGDDGKRKRLGLGGAINAALQAD